MGTQKKYICAFCARAFTRSEHKQRHERSHTNEKPFHCLHCTSAFVRRDLLQRHCRTVHNIQLNNSNIPSNKTISPTETIKSPPIPNNELIHLLSISKKLETLLINYDAEIDCNSNCNNNFLIGYTLLSSNRQYPIFENINKELINFLNSNMTNSKVVDFKVCLIYSIVAIGFANNNNFKDCIKFFNKSWSLLILKLIPNYNNNYNLIDQIEILNSLFTLAFIYLTYNLNVYQSTTINCDIIFYYLSDISFIIMSNLSLHSEDLINSNMNLFWSIYIILSKYLINSRPPKFFKFFLNKKLTNLSLRDLMENYSKSRIELNSNFVEEIVVLTLSNELNHLINYNKLLIFDSKNSLHNSIILINKSINQLQSNFEIFELFKKKLIINSPLKFHDLLNSYIFNPRELFNWNLLIITLKEFNFSFNFNEFLSKNLNDINFQTFENNLLPFFNNVEINNNLVIVSFPLIFNLNFLKISNNDLKIIDFGKFSFKDLNNLSNFVIEWYLTMFKVLIKLFKEKDNNYILQNLIYLIVETNFDDFKFNDKWFWFLKLRLDLFFESWLNFINYNLNNFSTLKVNLNKFLSNLIRASLSFSNEVEYVAQPSQKQRSNSITLGILQSSNSPIISNSSSITSNSSISPNLNNYNNSYFPSYTTITSANNLPPVPVPVPAPAQAPPPPVPYTQQANCNYSRNELLLPPILSNNINHSPSQRTLKPILPNVINK